MKLSAGALLLSLSALAVSWYALATARQKAAAEALPAGSPGRHRVETEERPAPRDPGPAPVAGTPSPPAGDLRSLEERVARIEEKIAKAEQAWNEFRQSREKTPIDRVALESTVLDRLKPPEARVSALKKLRWHAPEARTLEVVRSMLDLLRTSEDGAVRAEICRQLSGVEYPEVAPEMVNRLRSDADEETRKEAAEALLDFIDEPGVLQALEAAKQSDPSEDVRLQAVETIEKSKARDH